ncbi:MAG TPA: hypothetical protein VJA66_05330 [Thermoanaerobaculia bacterium]
MERSVPTYEDAQLVLKLYELRREEKLRAAREWFIQKFYPTSVDDVQAVRNSSGNENVYFRMATTYWDMAASFVVRGVLNVDLFLDSAGEMIVLWTKLEPFIPQVRTAPGSDTFLANIEQVVKSSPRAQDRVKKTRERFASRMRMAGPAKS